MYTFAMGVNLAMSPRATEALRMLGASIRAARKRRRWTVDELAERVGVSTPTARKVERGDPTVAVGTMFEAAVLVGVPLFDQDPTRRELFAASKSLELALLPAAIRPRAEVDDDF